MENLEQRILLSSDPILISSTQDYDQSNLENILGPIAAATAPAQVTGAPTLISGFGSIRKEQVDYGTPADPHGAVGPRHVVSAVNNRIEWRTKDGTFIRSQSLESFFGAGSVTGYKVTDPRVIYDQHEGRFVASVLQVNTDTSDSSIYIAVTNTDDPTKGWKLFHFSSTLNPNSSNSTWPDQPTIAVDKDALYITGDMAGGATFRPYLWIVDKAFYTGGTFTPQGYDPVAKAGFSSSELFTRKLRVAHVFGTASSSLSGTTKPVGTFLVGWGVRQFLPAQTVGDSPTIRQDLMVIEIESPLSNPVFKNYRLDMGRVGNVSDGTSPSLPDAPQQGTNDGIEANTVSITGAVWRDNALWMSATTMPADSAHGTKAQVTGSSPQVVLSGDAPDLHAVKPGDTIRFMGRTDGLSGTDVFEILSVNNTAKTLSVSPTPGSSGNNLTWSIGDRGEATVRWIRLETDHAYENLLTNGTFEAFTGSAPDSWDIAVGPSNVMNASFPPHGSGALEIKGHATDLTKVTQTLRDQSNSIPGALKANHSYLLAANVGLTSLPTNNARLRITLVDGSGQPLDGQSGLLLDLKGAGTPLGFAPFESQIDLPATLPAKVQLAIELISPLETGVGVHIDDISLREMPQSGLVTGEDIAPHTSTYFPSIAVNAKGQAAIGFSASGPQIYAGAYVVGLTVLSPGVYEQTSSQPLAVGEAEYVHKVNGQNRWGDYSATVVDPITDAFWAYNMYATPEVQFIDQWSTQWGELSLGAVLDSKFFLDQNADGVQQPTELGVSDVTVHVYQDNGDNTANPGPVGNMNPPTGLDPWIATVQTGATGSVHIPHLVAPGKYFIQVMKPAAFQFTTQNQGGDENLDSDVDTNGISDLVAVNDPNDIVTALDVGLRYTGTTIGDLVFQDKNGNGTYESLSDAGVAGVTAYLFRETENSATQIGAIGVAKPSDGFDDWVATAVTNQDGKYLFFTEGQTAKSIPSAVMSPIPDGKYYVQFKKPKGMIFVDEEVGNDGTVDSNVITTNQFNARLGNTKEFTLTGPVQKLDIDAGVIDDPRNIWEKFRDWFNRVFTKNKDTETTSSSSSQVAALTTQLDGIDSLVDVIGKIPGVDLSSIERILDQLQDVSSRIDNLVHEKPTITANSAAPTSTSSATKFMLRLDDEEPVEVVVPATSNVVAAVNAALVAAGFVDGNSTPTLTASLDGSGHLEISAVPDDLAKGMTLATLQLTAANVAPSFGQTTAQGSVEVRVTHTRSDGSGGTIDEQDTRSFTLGTTPAPSNQTPFPYTQDNANVQELADDLNLGFAQAGLFSVKAIVDGGKLVIAATDPEVTKIELLQGGGILNFGSATVATVAGPGPLGWEAGARAVPELKFSTIEDLVAELNNALSSVSGQTFNANVVHDTQANALLFDFNLNVDFLNQDIALDFFDGIDLGPFQLELSAIADASIDVGVDLHARMGISLDPLGRSFTLDSSTLLSELNSGDGVDFLVGMTAANAVPAQGQPGNNVNFTIDVDREGISNDSSHSFVLLKNKDTVAPQKPSTDDNSDASALVDDLNLLFEQAGLETVLEAGLITDKTTGGQIITQHLFVTALDPTVRSLQLSGPDIGLLGFAGTSVASNYPDLVLTVGTSTPVDIVLDGAETVQDVLDRLATASSGAITAAVGGDDNIALFSSMDFTLMPAVVPTLFENGGPLTTDALTSRAGISLGILGESDNGILEGAQLHGESVDDLIFIVEEPQGQQNIELSLNLNGNLDLGAAIGPLGLSLTTPSPVSFEVTSGMRLVDPNADDGLIHLSELFAAPSSVFDFTGLTPTFQASGTFELSANFLGGTDDNANILGDVLGMTTAPTITVDIMADNDGFDFAIDENVSQISLQDMLDQLKQVSPEQIITLIGDLVEQIKENPDLPFLNKKLPVIDKSLNEIVDFADALLAGIEQVINDIDLDVLGDAVEDLATAINNVALPEPVKVRLLQAVDVLRRISGDLDPAQLVDEFNVPTEFARRLPARLLSGVIQAGKEIQAALATIPGNVSRPVAGELDLEEALANLAELVPGINTIEARIEDAVGTAIATALGIPLNDVQFHLGFISDYDSTTPLTKQRALVVGLSIDVNNLSLQFAPEFPGTEFGPIELQLDSMLDLYAGAQIDLGLGVTLESSPKVFVIAEPPPSTSNDFDDDLVKTQLEVTAGFAGSLEGKVKFGSLDLITAQGALDLLTSVDETGLTIDGQNQVTLQAAPVGGDRRFVIVAVDGTVSDVDDFEVSGNKITFLNNIPTSGQSIDVFYQSTTTPPPEPTSGPDLRAMTESNRAGVDVTFDDATSFVNTIGAIEFGDLGNNVQLDAHGLLTGSVGAKFLGNEVSDAATLALSLAHPLDPQLTVDADALTGLLENVDFDLKTILIGIEAFLDKLEEGLTDDVLARLPIVGGGFDAGATFIGRLRDDFVTPLRDFLCNVGGNLDEVREFVREEVFRLLGPGLSANAMSPGVPANNIPAGLGILKDRDNDSDIDLDDVDVDLTLDNFSIAVSIGGQDKVEVDFDSGLAGLPIVADAQGGVELGWEYTIDLGFGIDRYQGFYLITNDNAGDAEFRLDNFGASLIVDTASGPEPIPTSLTVDLLGLKLSATDVLTSAGEAGTAIGGDLMLDLNDPDNDMRLFISEITKTPFKDLFDVGLDAGVSIDLLLEAGINDTLPSIQAELVVDWSADLDIIGGQVTFASTGLNAGFENIGINLGDFLNRHIGSAIKQITKFIEPLEPVIRALKKEVPGVSAISEAKGNGPVTFLDLALLRIPDKAEQARKFIDAVDTLLEISHSLESVDPDSLIFVLQDEFKLIQGGTNELEDPEYSANVDTDQLVQTNPAQEDPAEEATGGIRALLQKIENLGINLHFLETKNLINFLLKRPFDVISYELPRFELPFTFEKSFPVWTPPKIDIRVGLDASIFADLSVGYDSHGLDTGRFFDGFYFGDREEVFVGADIDEFGLGLGVRLAALLDVVVASAGVEGEIRGDVLANWRDLDDDGKLHLDELTQIVRNDGVECLFDLHGELSAIVRLVWEVLGKEGSKELYNKVLFEFSNSCPVYELGHVANGGEALPGGPNATAAQGTLILHAGAFASERRSGATSDIAEAFTVKQLAPGVFQVSALDLQSRYSGVTQIFFDGGRGNDQLTLDGVDVPVVALGGPGDDILYGTKHSDYLDGGDGNDELYARGGTDTVLGGAGDDLIYGDLAPSDTGSIWGVGAMDTIDGGAGNDTIYAAEGDDQVDGGAGDDLIFGDSGIDTIHAGTGNDTVYGGDDGDFLFGEAGKDALYGESGDDQADGGTGTDLVMGHAGADILSGGSGIDVIIGGLGADQLFGEQGNDLLIGGLATGNPDLAVVVGTLVPDLLSEITSQEASDVTAGTPDDADDLWGGVDNDLLVGDAGGDRQFGGWGNDVILANQINLPTTSSAEYIEGGPDDDFICGANGIDTIFGGTADTGLAHILSEAGATPTMGGFSLLSCTAGEIMVEPPPTNSSLAGVKFHDGDGDGVRDENESALAGWTILLLDGDGDVIASTETDSDGAYLFDQLSPGDYQLAEEQQTDWVQTTVDYQVALLADQQLTDLDFGNQFNGASVSGQKWHDLNGNGTRESNELGLNGWQIVLTDEAGTESVAVTADVDLNNDGSIDAFSERGVYQFVDLPSGNYALSELPKAGWIESSPQLANSEVYAPITDDGYSQTRSDLFVDSVTGVIQTIDVMVQVDHPRLSDLTGFLLSPAGTRVDLTEFIGGATDPLGVLVGEEVAGVWTLVITDNVEGEVGKLLDWQLIVTTSSASPPPLEGGTPSPVSPGRLLSYDLSLESGDDLTRNFGNYQPAVVEGTKFVDRNGNGVQDREDPVFPGGEKGLAGVVIYADLNDNGMLDRGEPSTTTESDNPATADIDETGYYRLPSLPPRAANQGYFIREVIPEGYTQTFPVNGGHEIAPLSGEVILDMDFGNAPPASVHGEKWLDENGNGIREENEPGVAGVIIYADLNNNQMRDAGEPSTLTMPQSPALLVADADADLDVDRDDLTAWENHFGDYGTSRTSGDFDQNEETNGLDFLLWQRKFGSTIDHPAGAYWLDGLPAGEVIIREIVPEGWIETYPEEHFHLLVLAPGEIREGVDFGNRPIEEPLGSIHGTKWIDTTPDGVRDGEEIGLAFVEIYIDLNNNGKLDDGEPVTATMPNDPNTPVDETGAYWFSGLPAGEYVVREVVPDNSEPTYPQTMFHTVLLGPGETVTGIDFGNWLAPDPTGGDSNGDGDVDGTDLNAWETGFAKKFTLPAQGNFDGNSVTNGLDFLAWQRGHGTSGPLPPVSAAVISGGLVALWDFENDLNDMAPVFVENVGIFNDDLAAVPTPPGAFYAPGLVGDFAIQLGTQQFVTSTATGDLSLAGFTIELLVNPEVIPGTTGTIFRTIDQNIPAATRDIRLSSVGGSVRLEILQGGVIQASTSLHPLVANQWSHIAVTGSGTDQLNLYIDGMFVDTLVAPGPPIGIDAVDRLEFGGREFAGLIDKVAVWDSPLVDVDILAHAMNPQDCYGLTHLPGDEGSIHGHKFADLNGNGQWDPNEPPIADWVIELSGGDLNGDGVVDQADRLTATTNAMGEYWFMGFAPALYTVSEVPQPNWTQTTTGGTGLLGMLSSVPGTLDWTIELGPGDVFENVDFGNQPTMGDVGSIHGQKWHDRNADRQRDLSNEEGLDGWQIELLDSKGTVIATTTTMSMDINQDGSIDPITEQGHYWFQDVAPGTYQLREIIPTGWRQTVPGILGGRQPGDANEDGVYDEADRMQVLEWNLFNTGLPAQWFQGDFNNDGVFNQLDRDLAQGTPYDPDGEGNKGASITVTLAPGQTIAGVDFANYQPVLLPDGDDKIYAGGDDDVIRGDNLVSDPTVLSVGTRRDMIFGQLGRDKIFGQEADDQLWGADEVLGLVAPNTDDDVIVGGIGTDEVLQTVDNDQTLTDSSLTGQGPDQLISIELATLTGGASNNTIDATTFSGSVRLFGAEGDDTLLGSAQDDYLDGERGSDFLVGRDGDDQYAFGPVPSGDPLEQDLITELANEGIDLLDFSHLDTSITVDLTSPTVALQPGTSNVRTVSMAGAGQQANLEDIRGTQQDDILTGNSADNRIWALGGTDNVAAGGGNDTIDIGPGLNETITGGAGDDLLLFYDDWGSVTISDSSGDDTVDFSAVTQPLTFTIGSLNVSAGANAVTHSGNDFEHLIGGSSDDQFVFDNGAQLPLGGTIDAGSGVDWFDYDAYLSAVTVNLASNTATGASGGVSGIENVRGGQAGDALTGDSGPNVLEGGPGADTLSGLAGDDQLDGGDDADTLLGGDGNDLLEGGLGNDNLDGQQHDDLYVIGILEGSDVLNDTGTIGVDRLDLSSITDDLDYQVGATAAPAHTVVTAQGFGELVRFTGSVEQIDSGSGDDQLILHSATLLAGAIFDAGEGVDTVDYSAFAGPVTVNLSDEDFDGPAPISPPTHPASSANGIGSLLHTENAVGSPQDDLLIGSDADNLLEGGAGDDTLIGLAGNDRLNGGPGDSDLIGGPGNDKYVLVPGFTSVGIFEDLGTVGMGFAATGGIDTIDIRQLNFTLPVDISTAPELENIFGSLTQSNNLTGNANNNWIVGGNAADVIRGGDGDDLLVGLDGDDWIEGGAGNDVLLGGLGNDGTGVVGSNPRKFDGGAGRDILVGGQGGDNIMADDEEEDLLIAGETVYDDVVNSVTNRTAWQVIRDVWSSTVLSRATRESLLTNGVGTVAQGGPFLLVMGNTISDTAVDTVTYDSTAGSSSINDWIFVDGNDSQVASVVASIREETFAENSMPLTRPGFAPSQHNDWARDRAFEILRPAELEFGSEDAQQEVDFWDGLFEELESQIRY